MKRTRATSLLLAFVFASSVANATDDQVQSVPFEPIKYLRESGSHSVDKGGLWILGVGTGVLIGARGQDEEMQEHFRGQKRLGDHDSFGNEFLGTGVPGVLLGGGLWWYGASKDDARTIHAGQASLEAIATTSILVSTLKFGVNRERPDGSDRFSFPSGHTSTVFASAGVLHQFYGWKVGLVAESLGVLTGLSRVSANRHWFSDTVGGGLIGFVIGRAIARAHLAALGELSDDGNQHASFTVVPFVDSDVAALRVAVFF